MEPEGLLRQSQVPATCPYPEPARSSPNPPIPLPEDPCRGDRDLLITVYLATGYEINWCVESSNQQNQ
jgi:hypothetical protein